MQAMVYAMPLHKHTHSTCYLSLVYSRVLCSDYTCCTTYLCICIEGYLSITKLLLDSKADVNLARTKDGCQPLHLAAENGTYTCPAVMQTRQSKTTL